MATATSTTTTTIEAAREKIASILLDERCHVWIERQQRPALMVLQQQRHGQLQHRNQQQQHQQQQQRGPNHENRPTGATAAADATAASSSRSPNFNNGPPAPPPQQPQPRGTMMVGSVATAATTIFNLLKEHPSLASERFEFPRRAKCGRTMYPLAYYLWNSFGSQWVKPIYRMYPQALSLVPPAVPTSGTSGTSATTTTNAVRPPPPPPPPPPPEDDRIDVYWGDIGGGGDEGGEDSFPPTTTHPYYLYQNVALKANFGCPTIEEYVNQCFLPLLNSWWWCTSLSSATQQAFAEQTLLWLIEHLPPELTSSLHDGYLFRHIIVSMNEHYQVQQSLFQQQQQQQQQQQLRARRGGLVLPGQPRRHLLSPRTIKTFFSKMKEHRSGRCGSGNAIHEGHVEQLIIAGYPKDVLEYAFDAMLVEDEPVQVGPSAAMLLMMRFIPGMTMNEKKRLTFNGRWKFQSIHADLFAPRLSLLSWLHLDPTLGWSADGWCRMLLAFSRAGTLRILGLTGTTTFLLKNETCMDALGRFLNTKPNQLRFSFDLIGGGGRASLDPRRQRQQQEERQRRKDKTPSPLSENQRFFEAFAAMLQTPEDETDPLSTPILLKQNWLFDKLSLHNFQQCDFRDDQGNDIIDLLVTSSKQLAMDVTGMGETNTTSGSTTGTTGQTVDIERRVALIDESRASSSSALATGVVSAIRRSAVVGSEGGLPSSRRGFCPTQQQLQIGLERNGALATQQVFQSVFAFSSMLSGNISMEYANSKFNDKKLSRVQQLNNLQWTQYSPCYSLSDRKILTGLTIDISGVGPGQHDITDYLVLFLRSPTLRRLYIKSSDIEISSSGEEEDVIRCDHNTFEINRVCQAIRTNKSMKRLELEDLHIHNDRGHVSAAPAILARAMEHNTTMKVLTINDQKVGYTLLEPWISDFKYVDVYNGATITFYLWLNECGRGTLRNDDATVQDLIPCLVKAMNPSERTEEALQCGLDALHPPLSTIYAFPETQASECFDRLSRTVGTWSIAPLYTHRAEVLAALYALLRECPDVWSCSGALLGVTTQTQQQRQQRQPQHQQQSCRKRGSSSEIALKDEEANPKKKIKYLVF